MSLPAQSSALMPLRIILVTVKAFGEFYISHIMMPRPLASEDEDTVEAVQAGLHKFVRLVMETVEQAGKETTGKLLWRHRLAS